MSPEGLPTAVCVVNPRSGGGRTGARWPAIEARLRDAGIACEARFTTRAGEGEDLARAALRAGAELVVAVGGDGTVHEVTNGFFEGGAPVRPDARLGVIPAGSGSDLIKTLGIPADPAAAVDRLRTGTARPIDVARLAFTGPDGAPAVRYAVNIASVGMAATVLEKMATLPAWVHGQARYVAGSLLAFADLKPFDLTWRLDGEEQPRRRALIVAVGNARYFGAGMHVLPQAVNDDGLMDLVVVEERPLWELLPAFAKIYDGSHLQLGLCHAARGRKVEIDAAAAVEIDGEIAGRGPVTIEVVPAAIRVVA